MFSYTNLLEGFVAFLGPDADNIADFFESEDVNEMVDDNLETQEEKDLLSQGRV